MNRRFRSIANTLAALAVVIFAAGACSDDDANSEGDEGSAGNPFGNADGDDGDEQAGTRAGGGSGGVRGGGETDAGGTRPEPDAGAGDAAMTSEPDAGGGGDAGEGGGSADAGGTPGGPMGTQPIGAACANDGNCSQAMGETVCCINSCELVQDCPESPGYLPCTTRSDCQVYGGAKVCCELGTQRFCTKQSGCGGQILP